MESQEEQYQNPPKEAQEQHTDSKLNAYRVDDGDETDEASLRKNYGMGGEMKDA